MRNLKRALSLALASVMLLGMMVVGTSAASYPDVDENDNVEAIEVLNAVQVMIGDRGNFRPDAAVNRHEMAVIMAKLVLGNEVADNYVGSHPFTDTFPWADKYVAACYENDLISGRGGNLFAGNQPLTAVEAASMMLRALGYKDLNKGASDWRAPLVSMANQLRLFSGVTSNPNEQLNRNQVAQLVLNTLKSSVVDLKDNTFTATDGNGKLVISGGNREYIVRSSREAYAYAINDVESAGTSASSVSGATIELGEHLYEGKLRLNNSDTDVFGRPSRSWEYDGKEIGTYAKDELLRKTYTNKVTGKDLYDLLGTTTRDYKEYLYVDGESAQSVLGSYYFDENNMIRTNTNAVGGTGKGVLTEVYVDTASKEITIAIINTYLAKATKDYDAKNNEARFTVYNVKGSGGTSTYVKDGTKDGSARVSDEDFALIKDVKEKDLYLVTLAQGEVQSIVKPEVLDSTTITSFSKGNWVNNGTKYEYASTARYDAEVLDEYDNKNMKDLTYNIILDKYGYLIGLELNEDPDQYVFLTGIEGDLSNLGTRNVDGNIIFLDGTMKTVTINGKDSTLAIPSDTNWSQVNAWYTYSVNSDNTYVLERVANGTYDDPIDNSKDIKVAQSAQSVSATNSTSATPMKINQRNNVGLDADNLGASSVAIAYGNKDTVYLGVSTTNIKAYWSNGTDSVIIDDVETISTGVTNVDLLVKELGTAKGTYECPDNEVYTLYKDNGAVIAVIAIGEDNGAGSELVFITGNSVNQEDDNGKTGTRATGDGKYTWYLKAIVAGETEERNITEVGNSASILKRLSRNTWYELRFDADGNVRKVDEDSARWNANRTKYLGIDFTKSATDKFLNVVTDVKDIVPTEDTVLMQDTTTVTALRYVGNTLYTTVSDSKGFPVSENVNTFLILAGGKGDGTGTDWYDDVRDEYQGASGLKRALEDMNAQNLLGIGAGTVEVSAVLKNGVATTIIINDKNKNPAKDTGTPGDQVYDYTPQIALRGNYLDIKAHATAETDPVVYTAAYNYLTSQGYTVQYISGSGPWNFYASRDGRTQQMFITNLIPMVKLTVNGVPGWYCAGDALSNTTADTISNTSGKYFAIKAGGTGVSDYGVGVAYNNTLILSGGVWTGAGASITSNGATTITVVSAIDGYYIKTNMSGVMVDSDGTSGTPSYQYYQNGENIGTKLVGNWYAVTADNATPESDATKYRAVSNGLVMSDEVANKCIWDNYVKVEVSVAQTGATGRTLSTTKFAIKDAAVGSLGTPTVSGGSSVSNFNAEIAANTYVYDSLSGEYIKIATAGELPAVSKDVKITDYGYYWVKPTVTVSNVATSMNGMDLTAAMAGGGYVKLNGSSKIVVTLTMSITDNGKTASGAVKAQVTAAGATVDSATTGTGGATDIKSATQVITSGAKVFNTDVGTVTVTLSSPAAADIIITLATSN